MWSRLDRNLRGRRVPAAVAARRNRTSDEKNPKRAGTREICGTGTTNVPGFPPTPVYFHVEVTDTGPEPGRNNDVFKIRFGVAGNIYSTYGDDGTLKGGNIQLHKPNPSTTGESTGVCNI